MRHQLMLDEHIGYLADAIRLDAFRTAIAKTITPGTRVADLGSGSGILGLLCLQADAASVCCIESTAMIDVAREMFERAGLAEKVNFIRGHSSVVALPTAVDLVICDHVGYFGFDYGIIETLKDARNRFLNPHGRLIPARIRLHLGAVQSEMAQAKACGWVASGIPAEFHWLRNRTVNQKHAATLSADNILTPPATLGEIDLHADQPEFFSWRAELAIARDGVMHGLAGWFECELADGVWMTNSPLANDAIERPQAFLPIDAAVPVCAGDVIKTTVMARPADHLIAWAVECPASGQRFSHSTWQGMVLAPDDLIRAQPDRIPRLSREGEARLTVLQYCDGQRSAGEIERLVRHDHPDLFPSPQALSRFVMQVLSRDTA